MTVHHQIGRSGFVIGDPSLEFESCPRFDMAPITTRSLAWEKELLKLPEPAYVEKHKMLNNHKRWSHSSFERKFFWLECQQVVFWCQHIWFVFWGPRQTPWVLDTCLNVGLRPFKYHLDDGFVFFKDVQLRHFLRRMYVGGYVIHFTQSVNLLFSVNTLSLGFGIINCRVGLNMLKFSWTSMVGSGLFKFPELVWPGWMLSLVVRSTSITMSQRSRANNPSIRSDVCFLHVHNWLEQMFCFQRCTRHLLRLTLNPQDLQQSLSLQTNPLCNAVPCFPRDNIAWVHFVTDLASLFTEHKMSGRPIRAKCKHCQEIFWAHFWQFSNWFQFIFFWTDGRPNKDEKFCRVAQPSYLPIHSIVHRIFEHVLPCRGPRPLCAREVSAIPVIFCCSSRNTWCEHRCVLFNDCFIRFAFSLSASQIHVVKKWCGFINPRCSSISSTLGPNSVSFQPL